MLLAASITGPAFFEAVLALCPGLFQLDLGGNQIRFEGAGRLAGVLPLFPSLSELYLGSTQIRVDGAERRRWRSVEEEKNTLPSPRTVASGR